MSSIFQHTPIVLASKSSIRKTMLEDAGLTIECIAANIDETILKQKHSLLPFDQLTLKLAEAKAAHVSHHTDSLVIAADQICECDGNIFSKPETIENAVKQLQQMNNKSHHQHSGVCVFHKGKQLWSHVETATLTFRNLDTQTIENYVKIDKPLSSCGSYKLESYGVHLFSEISGTDSTIKGLPLIPLLAFLHEKQYVSLRSKE